MGASAPAQTLAIYQPVLGAALSVTGPRGSNDGGTKTMRLGGWVAATDGAAAR